MSQIPNCPTWIFQLVYVVVNMLLRSMTKGMPFLILTVNFPYMSSNIPANPTYGVYISQLIKISRICDTFQSFCLKA